MLRFFLGKSSDCQAASRRQFLQLGGIGAFGLSLSGLLRSQSLAAEKPRKDVNCILLWMSGGPSHHDTFDPKPDAPMEFAAISKPFRPPCRASISPSTFLDWLVH